jgi:hypothetical protein
MKTNTPEMLNMKEFYKELGHLLYAVAYSDGTVRKKEFHALRDFILKEVAPSEHTYDSSGMNKAFYTEFTFEALNEAHERSIDAYSEFISYFRNNSSLIGNEQRKMIGTGVKRVSAAYKGVNRKEAALIDRLEKELTI